MQLSRLDQFLDGFPRLTILVVGDFFLDWYLSLDRSLTEKSLETGLDAHQVVAIRAQPGAAGTVTSNLRELGVRTIGLGALGDDGLGVELRRALEKTGVDCGSFVTAPDWMTPTYTKPMLQESVGIHRELNRLDFKNRRPLTRAHED